MKSIQSIVMTILLLLSICSVLEVSGGIPPSLTLFTPQIDGLTVTINGVTMPGMSGTSITKIHWDWGDGYSEDHWFANSHPYPNNGTYIITVASYQSDGLTTTKARVVSLGVPPKTPILLLVNETIYPSIANRLSVFRQDISFDGYDAIVSLLSNGLDVRQIKDIIKSYYTENNITGGILIGDIKAAYTEFRTGDSSSVWISLDATDMYYMDLDGYWENVTHPDFYAHRPPGDTRQVFLYESCQTFYDEYIVYLNESKKWDYSTIENKAQYKAEIWVSRMMGHNLVVSGKNETDIINEFLDWNHAFRTERKRIEDRAYLLNAIGSGYNDQNMNYSSIFDSIVKKEYVTKNDYLNCLRNPNGSKLTYLTAHSGPQVHCLYDTNLMVDELADSNKTSVFYILNACSSCRWDQYVSSPANPNYLGGIYVFDKSESDYGLGAIGFTGVGGFNWLEFFTDYLNANPYGSYGEAYKYWFNENLMRIFTAWNYVYLGDPIIGPSSPRLVRNIDTGLRYEKIQEAINAPETQDGHTIVVGAGTYYENVVVNKTISLLGENREKTIIDGKGAGNTISVIANGVLISDLTATNCGDAYPNSGIFLNMVEDAIVTCSNVSYNKGHGIFVMWGTNNSLLNNVIEYNVQPGIRVDGTAAHALIANNAIEHNQPDGIFLYSAYHVLIENNTISNNKQCGITPQGGSTNITIRHNFVLNNGWHGICFVVSNDSLIEANTLSKNGLSGMDFVGSSDHNSIRGNTVEGNSRGISFYESSNNSIIHNNFWNNTSQVDTYNSVNSWDDGYPSGGNYWSDYTDVDEKNGQNQDQPGSDGIWDHPYFINGNNLDNYPLVSPWTPWGDWQHYHDYSEIVNTLFYLNDQYPNIAELFSIGKSYEGKDIYCLKLTNETNIYPKPKVFFVGYHHARELISAELPLYFAVEATTGFGSDPAITRMLNYSEVYIVPALNVDGFEVVKKNEWQRKNAYPYDEDNDTLLDEDPPIDTDGDGMVAHLYFDNGTYYYDIKYEGIDTDGDGKLDWVGGADLNRNYGYQWNAPCYSGSSNMSAEDYRGRAPFSEPETQTVRDLELRHNFDYAVSFHSGTQLVLCPWVYTTNPTPDDPIFREVASNLSALVGVPYAQGSALYTASGTWGDWMYGNGNTLAFECEVFQNSSAGQTWPGPEPNTWWEKGVFQFFNPDPSQIETVIQRWLPVFTYTTNRAITEAYDITTTNVTPLKTVVGQGYSMRTNITVTNRGDFSETFNVTLYANTTAIATQTITLTSGNSTTVTFTWNTSGFAKGNYTINAVADVVQGETSTADNNFTDGWVFVSMLGDLTNYKLWPFVPDGKSDGSDLIVCSRCYGSNPTSPWPLKWDPNCDITNDNKIDGSDLIIVAHAYGTKDP